METQAHSASIGDSAHTTPDIRLACEQVGKTFHTRRGAIRVLSDVSFVAKRGEVLVITGRSGTGKSTLLSLLCGLDLPTTGEIRVDGQALSALSREALAHLRREQIGIIFQRFNLLSSWTAFENVEAALMHTAVPVAERRDRVSAILSELGLAERMENLPAELSIGQQQRVAVARTLVHAPALILADEPTGDVDPETGQEIIARLLAPVREQQATLIVATHGTFPLEVANRVLTLQDGQLT